MLRPHVFPHLDEMSCVMVMLVQDMLSMVACPLHVKTLVLYHFIVFLYCFHDV